MLWEATALWEYQLVANYTPADPALEVVPAAGWLGPAPAPFGTIDPPFVAYPPLGTAWPVANALWVRRALVVDGTAGVVLRGQIENGCLVYLDGVFIGGNNRTNINVPTADDFELIIPQSMLPEGIHELAVLAMNESAAGGLTWFYATADYLPTVQSYWPGPPVSETIGWLNDVQVFEDTTEEREQLRDNPRHQFRMSCFVPPANQQALRNALYGARARQWLLPLWAQVQHVGAVVAGEFDIDAVTSYSEFAADGRVILWQAPDRWQVLGIDKVVDADTLRVTSMTEAFDDAWLAPVRRAYLENDPTRAFNGRNSRVNFTFSVEENYQLTVAAPTQYLGNDIYFDAGLLDGDTTNESVTTEFELVDETLGLVQYSTPWKHPRPTRQHRMMGEDAEEAWAIRQWLHRRQGRLVPFWQPSFEVDLRVTSTGAVTTALRVANDDYLRYAAGRDHIAIETAAGWMARTVTDTLLVGANEVQLTLDTSIAVQASAILRVCFLGLRRLNSDRVEINWPGGTVCQTAVPVIDIAP